MTPADFLFSDGTDGSMAHTIRILVIDDAGLMREGLCALLRTEEGLEVVGAVATSTEAVRAAAARAPEIVIMDFAAATRSGLEAIATIRRQWPEAHIIVLTNRPDDRLMDAALHAGVEGYVLKNDSRTELMSAIRHASEGRRYITPSVAGRVVSGYIRSQAAVTRHNGPESLSDREREVMKLIAAGYRTREIAEQLSLSHKTIEKHRSNLMRKLGLRSATAVAAYAIANGYVVL